MRTATAKEIFAYWWRVRGGQAVPNRRDIDPAALRQNLPDLFILEKVAGAAPNFRLAGTRLCSLFGRELRNSSIERLFSADAHPRIADICADIMMQNTPALLEASAYGNSAHAAEVEILLLPMTSRSTHTDRIIGALCPTGSVSALDVPFRHIAVHRVQILDVDKKGALPQTTKPTLPNSVVAIRKNEIGQIARRVIQLRVFDGGK